MSPYQEALYWIEQHHGTGSARSLAQLILSLWNGDAASRSGIVLVTLTMIELD